MTEKLLVPDIGDFENVEVIELLVKEGQKIKKNDPVVTIESDKSSVEIPSTIEGVIKKIEVKVGDKVSKDDLLLTILDPKNQISSTQDVPKNTESLIKEAEKYATQKQSEFLKNVDMNNIPRTGNLQREQERAYENAYREYMERNKKAEGGIMGDQKDFEDFLQDMKERDMGRMQDQILRDFEEFMKRKKMIEQMPEAKDGGIMRMANGGMMDMGGMEMDLRGGGFVPMGKAEKADDVPARLSKNEFVFTADAVRAAGGGSIDKGADKMYATMKALENKVA